jgi:hypothetical protein
MAVASSVAWDRLAQLVATGTQLSNTLADEPLRRAGIPSLSSLCAPHVALSEARSRAGRRTIGSSSFVDRRDERCCIARKAFPAAQLQMEPSFTSSGKGDTRLWEVAVLFHLRDAFRSGDVWLAHSRRYGDLKQVLVPMIAAQENAKLAVPSTHRIGWQTERRDSRSLLSGWPGLPVTALFRTVA